MIRIREVKKNTATTVTRTCRDCLVKYSNLFVRGVAIGKWVDLYYFARALSKSETRISKFETIHKFKTLMFKTESKINVSNFGIWSFGFVSCFGFRISHLLMSITLQKNYILMNGLNSPVSSNLTGYGAP